jgi:hypothetical protein
MIVGVLMSSTSRRRYRKNCCEVQLIDTKPLEPCVGVNGENPST